MKRAYVEISDDEWEPHSSSFKPSRVLNSKIPPPLPSIESFAYSSSPANQISNDNLSSDDDSIEILDDFNGNIKDLEDDDMEQQAPPLPPGRGRRFVIDDDVEEAEEHSDDDVGEVVGVTSTVDDDDVVGKALHKCGKISAELRRELYGSSVAVCDRYAEVDESSSVRIVTQDDITEACGAENSEFQPILKPYQLVGVNFLLLLYKKRIGGGESSSSDGIFFLTR